MRSIIVTIRKDGSIAAETQGLKGTECLPYIDRLQAATDSAVVASNYTEEFYEAATTETETVEEPGTAIGLDR